MATATPDLLSSLTESCLLSADEIRSVQQSLGTSLSADELLAELVRKGILTPYQGKQIQLGQVKGLAFGQYRILEELGRGGFGRVFKAKHTLMDRIVALKMISPELVGDERARAWFLREVRAITQLDHPNIVRAYDAAEVDGQLFLAMEFIDGPNLEALVKQTGALPLYLAWELLFQSAQALQYAQEKEMVHRDIKPANLLIRRSNLANGVKKNAGLVKIVDFGLARLHNQGTGQTLFAGNDKSFAGTPDYISPEQARNLHDVDIRSDLYSLGCTFYLALTGRKPFVGTSPIDLIVQHWEKDPVPIEKLRPEVPPGFVRIIRKLMEKKRENRFHSPAELLAEMNFLTGDGELLPFPAARFELPNTAPVSNPSSSQEAFRDLPAETPESPPSEAGPAATVVSRETEEELAGLEKTAAVASPWTAEEQARLSQLRTAAPPVPSPTTNEGHAAQNIVSETQSAPAVAEPPPDPKSAARLPQLWRYWYATLQRILAAEGADLSSAEYKSIHSQLLSSIRASQQLNGDAKRPLYQRLLTLLEPWLALRTLQSTEIKTLQSLSIQSRELAQDLGLPVASSQFRKWLTVFGALVFFFAIGLFWLTNPGFVRSLRYTAWPTVQAFVQNNPAICFTILLPALVGTCAYGLYRYLRR